MKRFGWLYDNRSVLILIFSGILLVTLLYIKGRTVKHDVSHQQIAHSLRTLSQLDATLTRDILRTRYGLLNHYDSVTSILGQMREEYAGLRDGPLRYAAERHEAVLQASLQVDKWLESRTERIETFKSQNAVLLNSTRYLPFATEALIRDAKLHAVGATVDLLGEMARGILRFQAAPSVAQQHALEALIERLRREAVRNPPPLDRDIEMLLRHANIVVSQQRSVDQIFTQLVSGSDPSLNQLFETYQEFRHLWLQQRGHYQSALYSVAVFFIGYAAYFAVKQAKTATKALKLFQAVEQSPNAVAIADRNGKIEYVNRSFVTHTGYESEDVVGLTPAAHFGPSDVPPVLTTLWNLSPDACGFQGDVPSRRKDGTHYWASVSIAPINNARGEKTHILCVHSDITEPKRIHDALRESEARYRSLFDHANDAIYLINPRRREVVDCNQKAADLAGAPRELLTNTSIDPLFCSNATMQIGGHCSEASVAKLQMDSDSFVSENRFMQSVNGKLVPVEIHTAPVELNGEVLVLAIVRDITERKEAELKLRQYSEQLEELVSNRTMELAAANQELEAFTYSVSHDLRAPLRAMHGYSEALSQDYGDKLDGTALHYLRSIQGASTKMDQLIDDLLLLARVTRTELQKRVVDLSLLARDVAVGIQQRAPKRDVDWIIAGSCEARGDPGLLTIALDNLLGNAWKFTRNEPHAVIEFGRFMEGGELVYFVRDNGAGFNMEYADRLFGVFQRLHSARDFDGTGIGLSIVHRIIHRHGGRIWAQSRPGEGATFYFVLPDSSCDINHPSTSLVTQAA